MAKIVKICKQPANSNGYFYNDSSRSNGGHYVMFQKSDGSLTGTISFSDLVFALGYRVSEDATIDFATQTDCTQESKWVGPQCFSLNEEGWTTSHRNGTARLYPTRLEAEKAFHEIQVAVSYLRLKLRDYVKSGLAERI